MLKFICSILFGLAGSIDFTLQNEIGHDSHAEIEASQYDDVPPEHVLVDAVLIQNGRSVLFAQRWIVSSTNASSESIHKLVATLAQHHGGHSHPGRLGLIGQQLVVDHTTFSTVDNDQQTFQCILQVRSIGQVLQVHWNGGDSDEEASKEHDGHRGDGTQEHGSTGIVHE